MTSVRMGLTEKVTPDEGLGEVRTMRTEGKNILGKGTEQGVLGVFEK